jgi:hypothetical protein
MMRLRWMGLSNYLFIYPAMLLSFEIVDMPNDRLPESSFSFSVIELMLAARSV